MLFDDAMMALEYAEDQAIDSGKRMALVAARDDKIGVLPLECVADWVPLEVVSPGMEPPRS